MASSSLSMKPEEEEERIGFYLDAFLPYIIQCIDWKELTVNYSLYTPEQRDMLKKFGDSNPREGTKTCIDEILSMKTVKGRFRALVDAMQGNPKVVHILKGKMIPSNQYHRSLIHSFGKSFCDELNPIEVLPSLLAEDIIVQSESEKIARKQTTTGPWEAAFNLLFLLPNRNQHWYQKLIKVLLDNNHEGLAEKIDKDLCRTIKLGHQFGRMSLSANLSCEPRVGKESRCKSRSQNAEERPMVGSIREHVLTDYVEPASLENLSKPLPPRRFDTLYSRASQPNENMSFSTTEESIPSVNNHSRRKTPHNVHSSRMRSPMMASSSNDISEQNVTSSRSKTSRSSTSHSSTSSRSMTSPSISSDSITSSSMKTSSSNMPSQRTASRSTTSSKSFPSMAQTQSACSAVTAKCDIIMKGEQAILTLEKATKELLRRDLISRDQSQKCYQLLRQSQQYLQTEYQGHISCEDEVADHCQQFALSDATNRDFLSVCSHTHQQVCEPCDQLKEVLTSLSEASKGQDVEINKAVQDIYDWKKYIVRCQNQNDAKRHMFDNLSEDEALLVCDWADNFLPGNKPSSRYAKGGVNWHITMAFKKIGRTIQSLGFVHLFHSPVSKDSRTTCAVIMDVMDSITSQTQNATFHLWSDNASNYKSNETMCLLYNSSLVTTYDFCEAHDGQGVCDIAEAEIRRSIDRNPAVVTATDMKEAIDRSMTQEQYKVMVVGIDKPQSQKGQCGKIPAIKSCHNFSFEKQGIRAWKSYKVGPGCLTPKVKIPSVDPARLTVHSNLDQRVRFCTVTPQQKNNLLVGRKSSSNSARHGTRNRHSEGNSLRRTPYEMSIGWALKK